MIVNNKNIQVWLVFAQEDAKTSQAAWKAKIYSAVCFHTQQQAEKLIKALIVSQTKKPAPKIHDLKTLIKKIKPSPPKNITTAASYLSQFYLPTRYPDIIAGTIEQGLPNKIHAQKSLIASKKINKYILNKLK
ncbi:HEPN domain-containing protein [Patescibacteria group bacterium]|nr:HEPN domain-containing protein [Patescibacteria group bacterium]